MHPSRGAQRLHPLAVSSMAAAVVLVGACRSPGGSQANDGATQCASDELLDDSGACVPEACGASRWGSATLDSEAVYVDASAASGGDGSSEAPFDSIQAGADLAGQRGGGRVAIAAGTYVETVRLDGNHDGVELAGRCLEQVVLDGSEGGEQPAAILVSGSMAAQPTVALSGLTVTRGRLSGVRYERASGTVQGVALLDNTAWGMFVYGVEAEVDLDDVVIVGTLPDEDGNLGRGIEVGQGAEVTLASCEIRQNHDLGVYAWGDGTAVTLTDCSVADTQAREDGNFGFGVIVQDTAAVVLERCELVNNRAVGAVAFGAGATLALIETTVADTQAMDNGASGYGVEVNGGGELTLTSCDVRRNHQTGVLATGEGTLATLLDTSITDTEAGADGTSGVGVFVEDGASMVLDGCELDHNRDIGAVAYDAGTTLTLVDTTISNTQPRADGTSGRGIEVTSAAELSAESCVVADNHDVGVVAAGVGTRVQLADTRVVDTQPNADGYSGAGLAAVEGASLTTESCGFERNHTTGILVTGPGTQVVLGDTRVSETAPDIDGLNGYGVDVSDGATFSARSSVLEGNHVVGLGATGSDTVVQLWDTQIADTQTNANGMGGTGVQVALGAELTAESCVFERNHSTGILVTDPGTRVALQDTRVSETEPNIHGREGRGVFVSDGATLSAGSCELRGNHEVGLLSTGDDTVVTLEDVHIVDTVRGADTVFSASLVAQLGAQVDATRVTASDNDGPGLFTASGTLSCEACTVSGSSFAGAMVLANATLELTNGHISDTQADVNLGGGVGVFAGVSLGDEGFPTLTLTDTTIEAQSYSAVWLDGPGSYRLVDNTLSGGPGFAPWAGAWWHGDSLFATDGEQVGDDDTGLLLDGNTFQDGRHGVFLDGVTATLADNTWSGNEIDLWQQRCEETGPLAEDQVGGAATTRICLEGSRLTATLEFADLHFQDSEPLGGPPAP
jgi:hypothetical protein